MYIFYDRTGQYASAGVSSRDGAETSVDVTYLGRVLDKDRGIYKSRERGVFTFDPATGTFGSAPEDKSGISSDLVLYLALGSLLCSIILFVYYLTKYRKLKNS